jgi:CRISPR-associated protein Cas1
MNLKKSLYIYSNGVLIRKDNTLRFVNSNNENKDIPIEQYSDIYVFGEVTVNSALLNILSQYDINIHFFNYYDFYTGSFYAREKNLAGELLIRQVEHYSDSSKRLFIAQKFVDSASYNIYRNLRYYNSRGRDLQEYMKKIEILRKKIYETKSISELMGYEGNIRKIYYSSWNIIVNQKIEFEKRIKHPPDNMINTLISFVNSLIYTRILGEIYKTQLNPTISYLHEPGVRRFSLCLDLSEIFKPLIADRLIFSLLNKNQIKEDDFTKHLNYLHLSPKASHLIIDKFDEKMKTTIHHKTLDKDVSYQYLMRLEAYKLIKHIMGEKEYDGFKIWW